MYFLPWIIVGLVVGWSAGKILKGNAYGPLMDIAIGYLRSRGGRASHAIRRLWRFSGGHLYDSCCHDWCSPSDAARGFRERQKDVRSAILSVT